MEVALAAVKLAHEAGGERTTTRRSRRSPSGRTGHRRARDPARPGRAAGPRARRRPAVRPRGCSSAPGRDAGIRPGDLVGAITGETGLTGRDIGAIEIHQRFALVEVPESAADEVVQALRATMIKGRKATVRRDRT